MGHIAGSQNAFSWALLVPVAYKHLSCTPQTERESQLSSGWPPSSAPGALGQPGPTTKIHPSTAPSIYWAAVIIVILFTYSRAASSSSSNEQIPPSHYRMPGTHTHTRTYTLTQHEDKSFLHHIGSLPPSYLSAPLSGPVSTPSLL